MARPKEFDQDAALDQAVEVFASHGFEGSSTEMLLQAMGINRQSLYNTFGDKRQLYLAALQRYSTGSVGEQIQALNTCPAAFKGIEALMRFAVERIANDPDPKCLGVAAICEFGRGDEQVNMATDAAWSAFNMALKRRVIEAKAAGDVGKDVDPAEAAQFLLASLVGIKVAARGGANLATLHGIARLTLRGLR
jgi:AcrR family transcriptional regulator